MALDFPASPATNQTYSGPGGVVWVWDGSKWVSGTGSTVYAPVTSPVFLGNPTAPNPPAGDADTSVATTSFVAAAVAPALGPLPRSFIHNPLFNVAQRGAGPWTGGYTLDRWQVFSSLDTVSIYQAAFGLATLPADEAASFALANTFTGNAGATAFNTVFQPIEDVRRLSNKTVTISFYANTGSGTLKLGVGLTQSFGTGGSPSPNVVINGQSVTIGGGYARYSLTFTLPSISGKTLGTNNNHQTSFYFWYSSGANTNTQAGGVGVQSGTIYIWGVQLEIGSVATPLEKPDPRYDLANCQRFYLAVPGFGAIAYGTGAGTFSSTNILLPTTMRATPTAACVSPAFGNATAVVPQNTNSMSTGFAITQPAAGFAYANFTFTASADL